MPSSSSRLASMRFSHALCRVIPKAEQLCFIVKRVGHPPVLPAGRGAVQVQTAAISEFYGFVGSFEGSDLGVGERYKGIPWFSRDERIPE